MDNPNGVTVREATVADIEPLAPLFDAYRQFYRRPPDLSLSRQFLLERFEHNESAILVAVEQEGPIVGFAQLFPSFSSVAAARIYILNDLFVVPRARRNGVGRLLLRGASGLGRRTGVARLTLSTEVTNKAAQALYDAEGWIRQTDFYAYDLNVDGQ